LWNKFYITSIFIEESPDPIELSGKKLKAKEYLILDEVFVVTLCIRLLGKNNNIFFLGPINQVVELY